MRSDAQSNSFRRSTLGILGLLTFGLAAGPFACSDDGDGDDNGGSAGTSMAGSSGSGGSAGNGMAGAGGMGMAGTGGMGMAGGDMTGAAVDPGAAGPNGLALPDDVFDWRVLSMVTRSDNGQVRVVVGNDTAIEAARTGNTANWPEGTMIADLAWAGGTNDTIAGAAVPGDFSLVALMVKDSDEYSESGGWGYGAWTGMGLQPVGSDALDGCVTCHTAEVADNDYVFTRVQLPASPTTVAGATDVPNGVALPDGFLDWRVLGVVDRSNDANNPSVRVVLGNDTAVDAARAGQVNPDWPDGSMIGHIVWQPSDNDDAFNADVDGSVVPGQFAAITLMQRDSQAYAADGGWAYGQWTGYNLDPREEGFDAMCIDCHTDNVADNDYVFTIPGQLPNF